MNTLTCAVGSAALLALSVASAAPTHSAEARPQRSTPHAAPAALPAKPGPDQYTYDPKRLNLCKKLSATDERIQERPLPFIFYLPVVHGTWDWNPRDGDESLRTCAWHARLANVWYRCPRGEGRQWTIDIVFSAETTKEGATRIDEDDTKKRRSRPLICDGTWRQPYAKAFDAGQGVNFHVHVLPPRKQVTTGRARHVYLQVLTPGTKPRGVR